MPKKVSFTFHYKNAGVVSVVLMDGLIAEAGTVLSLHHNHAEIPEYFLLFINSKN